MKKRNDLLDKSSPDWLEVFQITDNREQPGSHVYMEAQIFTPDSKKFVLHSPAGCHNPNKDDPKHKYLLCDTENNYEISPITEETGAIGPAVSPCGKYFYYFIDKTEKTGKGRIMLKRVNMDGTERMEVHTLDGNIKGTGFKPFLLYPLSTISSDGKRIAISCSLKYSGSEEKQWGLIVFDIEKNETQLVIHGTTWPNMHSQYCRSKDEKQKHFILIQENHGYSRDEKGGLIQISDDKGADIHQINDDGTDFRNFPAGRDGKESCQGHQCWRGQTDKAIIGTQFLDLFEFPIVECRGAVHTGHEGLNTPGGLRNELVRNIPKAHFIHCGVDSEGKLIISDDANGRITISFLPEKDDEPLSNVTFLLDPRKKNEHVHPFLSPDGKTGFFNSDETGICQAYMLKLHF